MLKPPTECPLSPTSIAFIGASETSGKASERRTRSLVKGGFKGEIFLVNPKRDRIFGHKTYKSLSEINSKIDLVIIAIKPEYIPTTVEECIKKQVKTITIISAGLKETNFSDDLSVEDYVYELIKDTGINLIGPNCSGIFNSSLNINTLGLPDIPKGGVGVIAQSGNVIDSLLAFSRNKPTGFSKIISLGNKIDVNASKALKMFREDPDTKVILMYLESIHEGGSFIKEVRETIVKKPVLAIKSGVTSAGIRSTQSHTGALAIEDNVVDDLFKQHGLIRVESINFLFLLGMAFEKGLKLKGKNVGVISEGGGNNSITSDALEKSNLSIPVLKEEDQDKLRPLVLDGMTVANPIDIGGVAEEEPVIIHDIIAHCLDCGDIDAVVVSGFFGGFSDFISEHIEEKEIETAKKLVELSKLSDKPIVFQSAFAHLNKKALNILEAGGIPVTDSSTAAAKILQILNEYEERRNWILKSKTTQVIRSLKEEGSEKSFSEEKMHALLDKYKIPIAKSYLVNSKDEALEAFSKIEAPSVLKVSSRDVLHKSDIGGVMLDCKSEDEVLDAYNQILANVKKHKPEALVDGVSISPMIPNGLEVFVGLSTHETFGPLLMFGAGGVEIELFKDYATRSLPLSKKDIKDMIFQTLVSKKLCAFRGEDAKDIEGLISLIDNVQKLVINNPKIRELDLNPIRVFKNQVIALDVCILE